MRRGCGLTGLLRLGTIQAGMLVVREAQGNAELIRAAHDLLHQNVL